MTVALCIMLTAFVRFLSEILSIPSTQVAAIRPIPPQWLTVWKSLADLAVVTTGRHDDQPCKEKGRNGEGNE